jgi:hypothetical protein
LAGGRGARRLGGNCPEATVADSITAQVKRPYETLFTCGSP